MKKTAVICLAWLMLLGSVLTASASEKTEILTGFVFNNTNAVAEGGLKDNGYGDKDTGYIATMGEGLLFASVDGKAYRKLEWTKDDYSGFGLQPAMTGGNFHPWGEGAYFEVQVSTRGCKAVDFSAQIGATKKGPRDYQLQYSLDGVNFENVGEVYSLTDNKSMEQAFDHVVLPAEAGDRDKVYIRVAVVGEALVGGGTGLYGTTGGETAINNVYVTQSHHAQPSAGVPAVVWVLLIVGAVVVVAAAVIVVIVLRKKKV